MLHINSHKLMESSQVSWHIYASLVVKELTDDLRDNADIQAKSTDFIRKDNSITIWHMYSLGIL